MVTRLPYKGKDSQFNTRRYHLIVHNMCGTQPLHLQGVESLYLYMYKKTQSVPTAQPTIFVWTFFVTFFVNFVVDKV